MVGRESGLDCQHFSNSPHIASETASEPYCCRVGRRRSSTSALDPIRAVRPCCSTRFAVFSGKPVQICMPLDVKWMQVGPRKRTYTDRHESERPDVGFEGCSRGRRLVLAVSANIHPEFRRHVHQRAGTMGRGKPVHAMYPGYSKITDACDTILIDQNVFLKDNEM